ncbi:MAG: hypothetical protein R3F42_05525 [Pseudomonadota bacterium]
MSALELNLPPHLYVETKDQEGKVTGLELDADKLLTWAGHGHGNAIANYCREQLEREYQVIENWQERHLLRLDEQWLEAENGEDDDVAETRYALACERVLGEAERRRELAAAHLAQRQSAIEQLVQEAEAHLEEFRPQEDDNASMGLMFFLLAAGAAIFILYT